MTDNLETVADRFAICEAMARFCRTLDTKDWAGFADTLAEDFALDIAADTAIPIIKGRDVAVKTLQTRLGPATTVHHVHSPEFTLAGDEASVIWARQDRIVGGPKGRSITGYGHCYTRWLRQNGRWKMVSFKPTTLHIDVDPASQK